MPVNGGQENASAGKTNVGSSETRGHEKKLKFSYMEAKEYETIDDDIAKLEERIEQLDTDMAANATNSVKLREIMEEQARLKEELDAKMERWMYLNELAEKIELEKSER